MPESFEPTVKVQLFGGAMVAQFPESFADASTMRPVEDHQEVYLDKDGGSQSLILDILEMAQGNSEQEILDAHLEDILIDEESSLRKKYPFTKRVLTFHEPNKAPVEAVCLTQSLVTIPTEPSSRNSPNVFTYSVIRLTKNATDIVLTANNPQDHGDIGESVDIESSPIRELVAVTQRRMEVALATLDIKDWLLFG